MGGGGDTESARYLAPLFPLLYQMIVEQSEEHLAGDLAPVPPCLSQMSHEMAWARPRDPAVGSRRLTSRTVACGSDG
jgi:hypothetical protein